MGIREKLNDNPAITTGATIGIVVLALIWIIYSAIPSRPKLMAPPKAYYTVDDGETRFADRIGRPCPFDYEGKPAVQVHVFSCSEGKNAWVGYLEKISDAGMKKLDAKRGANGEVDDELLRQIQQDFSMVKAAKTPGKWVGSNTEEGARIRAIQCPHNDPNHRPMETFER